MYLNYLIIRILELFRQSFSIYQEFIRNSKLLLKIELAQIEYVWQTKPGN